MKKALPLVLAGCLVACTRERELQMSMMNVQLVKIDTVERYPNLLQQVLTWRSENNISYVTFEPLSTNFLLGSRMTVMVKR